MAHTFENAFATFMRSLTLDDKEWLEDYNCDALATLRFAKLDPAFINAALTFWDPESHCFNFNSNEITPLPEELGAIVGWSDYRFPCLPDLSDHFYKDFETFLGLSSSSLSDIVHGRELDLVKFTEFFLNNEPAKKLYRRRAIVFCLFARFLFVHSDPCIGHACIISIIEQCEKGKNPMPLCAGELLVSLDRAKKESRPLLTGCPLVLQVTHNPF